MGRWKPDDTSFAIYTEKELRTPHRTFCHPSVKALEMLLCPANGPLFDGRTTQSLELTREDGTICTEYWSAPLRFKLGVDSEELRFNHLVQVYTMLLNSWPVIHMVEEATHCCASSFHHSQSSTGIWKTIQHMWKLVYLGPPDFLILDQRSTYTSKEI